LTHTREPDISDLRIRRDDDARPGGSRAPLIAGGIALVAVAALAIAFLLARAPEVRVGLAVATGGGISTPAGISANGYVVARTKASVSAQITGRLEYIGVHEGSPVRRGEVIARVESNDYRAALAAAEANVGQFVAQLAQAKRDLGRAETLREQQLISESDLEDARTRAQVLEAQLAAARAEVALARANFENTRVRAPFDGTVLRKDAEVGEIVSPASAGGGLTRTAIVTMADLRTLEVEVDVNEAYIAQVRGDQAARITLDAYPDTSFAGRVRQVVPTADRQKATVQVKVSILDRDPRILPEMGAKVVFARDREAVPVAPRRVTVPASAVVSGQRGAVVWVVVEGRAGARPVELGPAQGDRVEVRRGLDGGESVVLQPTEALKEGARVRPVGT